MVFALQCGKVLRFEALLACCCVSTSVSVVGAAPDGGARRGSESGSRSLATAGRLSKVVCLHFSW